jgi:predicted flap endonuclease-1-like 5' DNA nuclease
VRTNLIPLLQWARGRRLADNHATEEVISMTLSNEVRQLSRHLLEGYDTRMAAVTDIRIGTARELAEFHAARQSMAVEQRQWLGEHMAGLRHEVAELSREAAAFLSELDTTRQSMAAEQRQWLGEQVAGLRRDVAELSREAAAFLEEVDSSHQVMAAEQRQWLDEQVAGLRRDVAAFLKEADASHQTMSAEQRQWLDEHVVGLRREVAELSREAAAFLKELGTSHQTMAVEQRQRLDDARARLASAVATMRQRLEAERRELQADQDEARQAWSSFSAIMQQRRRKAGKSATAQFMQEAPLPLPAASVVRPPAAEKSSDDLTVIKGIGPGMQRRLNQGGIYTCSQLARSTPEELNQILGDTARLAKVEEWIDEARKLARPA